MDTYRYLLKTAIDFGSTNTVIAWRVYEKLEDGTLVLSDSLNTLNPVIRIPSVMIFCSDNTDNPAIKTDLYGEAALKQLQDGNLPPVVCDNFKQSLYTANPGTDEYEKGLHLSTLFFGHLRELFKLEVYSRLPAHVIKELKVILYLSTPVRAHPTHRTMMKKIAQDAGFTAETGIHEICTDYDEAMCVVRYAMQQRKDAMQKVMAKAGRPEGAMLLFLDVGGSTLDASLQNFRITSDGRETMDPISYWPDSDVNYPLGGYLVDEAIRDYLLRQGFANQEYTLEKWSHGDGKYRFRMFKEENNELLKNGGTIDKLGLVSSVCADWSEDILPERNYNRSADKINSQVYISDICKDYIEHMISAITDLFGNKQRRIDGKPPVKPEDVDAVFLAGDGSRLFFIPQVLLGELGSRDVGFTQIKENPEQLFHKWDNPSLCCALGTLAEQADIIFPSYAKEQYFIRIRLYEHSTNLMDLFKSTPDLPTPETTIYYNSEGKEGSCNHLFDQIYPLADKYVMLPVQCNAQESVSYLDHCSDCLAIQMTLMRMSATGVLEPAGQSCFRTQTRKLGNILASLSKAFVGVVPFLVTGIAASAWDTVVEKFGGNSNLGDKVTNAYDKFINPKNNATLVFNFDCKLTENNQLTLKATVKSDYFDMLSDTFVIDV